MTSGSLIFWNAIASHIATLVPLVGVLLALACLRAAFGSNGLNPLRIRRKPLMTKVEAQTLLYLEALYRQICGHAQVAMSALIAPASGLSQRQRLWMH